MCYMSETLVTTHQSLPAHISIFLLSQRGPEDQCADYLPKQIKSEATLDPRPRKLQTSTQARIILLEYHRN